MKRATVAAGILIAFFLTWRWLGSQSSEDTAALQPVAEDAADEGLAPQEGSAETSEDSEGESLDAVESDVTSDSCAELHRRAEASSMWIAFAEGREEDEQGCATLLRMLFEPRVSAIPGFTGFEVRDMGDSSPRAILANEADTPEWSRAMEGAILQELTSLLDFQITTLHADCRSSTCGLLFAYRTTDHHGGNYKFYAQRLADELGFTGYHGGHSRGMNGNGFTFIYLGDWKTPRNDYDSERTTPDWFDELAGTTEADHPAR